MQRIRFTFNMSIVLVAAGWVSTAMAQTVFVTTSADVVDIPIDAVIDDLPGPDGVVSFREALRVSDNTEGRQTVGFRIPEDDWYLRDIFPGQVLLQGSRAWSAREPVTIDGTTQTEYTGDTYPDGNEIMMYGLPTYLGGDGSIVTGVHESRTEFNGSDNDIYGNTGGMFIAMYFGTGTVVHDNEADTININYGDNNTIVRNTTRRVRVTGANFADPAMGNRVGGPDPEDRNYITGWGNWGEHGVPGGTTVELYYTRGTIIENNYIGTTPDGMAIGNDASTVGIGIFNRNDDLTIRDNLIAILARGVGRNEGVPHGQPIYLEAYGDEDGPCRNISIIGNTLGLNALGEPVLGGVRGIWVSRYAVEYCENARIEDNVIAGHLGTGVLMEYGPGDEPAGGIRLSANAIYANGGIGIDLMPNTWDFGPTPNDPLDEDAGANGLQNYPVLNEAVNDGQSIRAVGRLHSEPRSNYTIEFFASPECDPSGFGEGEVYLGAIDVRTGGAGNANFDVVLPVSVASGWVLTSTATLEPVGATSEFSACVDIIDAGVAATLTDVTMVEGEEVGGGIPELLESDDLYYETAHHITGEAAETHRLQFIVGAETDVSNGDRFTITFEGRTSDPITIVTLFFRDWNGGFVQVAQFGQGLTDSVEVVAVTNANQYIREADGRIEMLVKKHIVLPSALAGTPSFDDQIVITVD